MNESTKQMTVLFIICDDLNDWILHPADHPQVKIPNIDRLRQKSVNFTNAHAGVPVCSPSRKCLFSGLYPQTIDSYDFAAWQKVPSLADCTPLPLHFRNNGYNAYGAGKLLHEGQGGDFYTDYGYDVDYGPHPWLGEGNAQFTPHPRQYIQWEGHLPKWEMHRDLNYGALSDVPEWKPGDIEDNPGAKGWYYKDATPFRYVNDDDRDRMPDEISVDWAIDILNQKHDQPFYLAVGLTKPHTPLYVPQKYFDMFPIKNAELPPYLENDLDDCAPTLRNRWAWGFQKFKALIDSGGTEAWREFVQAYLATIAFVDDQIGRLLNALNATPEGKNTIVILISDNGYHVGEKDCIQKWHLWNESTHIPLLIHIPGCSEKGQTCNHPVSHIDLYPTLIDFCNLPKQPHRGQDKALDGHSLKPFLDDPDTQNWIGPSVALMALRDGRETPHFSVCSHKYRYTLCANGEEEFYDHHADPHEWTNLSESEEHAAIRKKLRKELITMLHESKVPQGYQ